MCLVKNGSNMYLGGNEAKELVTICDHIHFSCKNVSQAVAPKGAGPWQNPSDTDTGNK